MPHLVILGGPNRYRPHGPLRPRAILLPGLLLAQILEQRDAWIE
jgi:hypothetical protein